MNQHKFDAVYRGLTTQAKKVYECVPISESWTPAQIMGELHRRNISMNDRHVVMGCLNSMIACGIVNEVPRGEFRREVIRPKYEAKEQVIEAIEPTEELEVKKSASIPNHTQSSAAPVAEPSALDLLGEFAQRLRILADDAERIAIAIAGQAEKNDAETAKLRQLQALLKSLG